LPVVGPTRIAEREHGNLKPHRDELVRKRSTERLRAGLARHEPDSPLVPDGLREDEGETGPEVRVTFLTSEIRAGTFWFTIMQTTP
jgi:hypothetical protein